MEFMAPLQHCAMFRYQCVRPLLQMELGAFLYSHIGALGRTPKGSEHRDLGVEPKTVVAPVTGSHHPTV
jgi:hypothetical protein